MSDPISVSDDRPATQSEKLRNAIEQVRKAVKCLALEVPPTVLADVSSQVEGLIAIAYAENTRAELNTRTIIPHRAAAADRPVENSVTTSGDKGCAVCGKPAVTADVDGEPLCRKCFDACPDDDDRGCQVPPVGWWCSRKSGHEGPCAARPISPATDRSALLGQPWVSRVTSAGSPDQFAPPVENSELREALDEYDRKTRSLDRLTFPNVPDTIHGDAKDAQESARSRIEELFASLDSTRGEGVVQLGGIALMIGGHFRDGVWFLEHPKAPAPIPCESIAHMVEKYLKIVEHFGDAEISRLRSERKEIAQEFGVSTDFDLGEHARVVMASLDDFKAELSRLRAIGEVR